ncbi:Expansin-like like [Melia azedarach]|uniref:Expansin-like like n=1 Tax=Melia azedarach TaxID=155640 RepID=A0ACC1XML9_MELAZ|nr:Expansin-like like [Melia azedarach]
MGFVLKYYFYLLSVIVLLPALCYSHDRFTSSRATYYGSRDCLGTPTGACGFGDYGRTINDAKVAGVSRLWKNGIGCGACYQVRCKVPQRCSENGVMAVVTDYGEGDNTDFILSPRAYSKLARPGASAKLFSYGVVDVEFRRVPCRYNYNLRFKVHEHSSFPGYLALVILYQAGQSDILAVDIWQGHRRDWMPMRRAYGAVFDIANPPRGSITLRFLVSGSRELKWVVANKAIPSDWKGGVAYDSQIQLTD